MRKHYKVKKKVGNKSLIKIVDVKLTELKQELKPKYRRNGVEVNPSSNEPVIEEIQELEEFRLQLNKNNKSRSMWSVRSLRKPCVYRLWKDNEVVYVGQTKSLIKRIAQHLDSKDFDRFEIYAVMTNEAIRLNIERRLIQETKPIYNKQHS